MDHVQSGKPNAKRIRFSTVEQIVRRERYQDTSVYQLERNFENGKRKNLTRLIIMRGEYMCRAYIGVEIFIITLFFF